MDESGQTFIHIRACSLILLWRGKNVSVRKYREQRSSIIEVRWEKQIERQKHDTLRQKLDKDGWSENVTRGGSAEASSEEQKPKE